MAKAKSRPANNDRSDRFYESLASAHPGFVDNWAPDDQSEEYRQSDHEPDENAKVTAIITLILAFMVTIALAVLFTNGISTIENAIAPSPITAATH